MPMKALLRKMVRRLAGVGDAEKRISVMESRVAALQGALDFVAKSPSNAWLYANRVERMDANVPFFDEVRRAFHLARYHFAAQYADGIDAADIACGTGYGADVLRRMGHAASVVGIDVDAAAVKYANEKYAGEGVTFVCASGEQTRLHSESLDLITSFETIEHVPSDSDLLHEFHRLLKPGGVLVCSTPNGWPLSAHHVRKYDRASFVKMLSKYFQIVAMFNQNSGSNWLHNHGQPRGIVCTTVLNESDAECYIAVCRKTNLCGVPCESDIWGAK